MMKTLTLKDIVGRSQPPLPWEDGDNIPWNDPDFSERMLREHLSQDHELASRKAALIKKQVRWLFDEVLSGRSGRVLDLACGPGLYLHGLCRLGCSGHGIDFGPASIAHARSTAGRDGLDCQFELGDLRETDFGSGFDLTMLLYGQVNVFRREEAREILRKAFESLVPGGQLVLEPQLTSTVKGNGSASSDWSAVEHGLFSASPHLQLHESAWDDASRTRTDRWYIVDAQSAAVERYAMTTVAWEPEELQELLREVGFGSVETKPAMGTEVFGAGESLYVIVARS